MLLNIRDIVTGWFAVLFVAVLIIPFAFWGVNYYFDQGGVQNVARVNDKPISAAEFQRAYQDYRRQLQNTLGEQMDTLNNEFLRRETLNRLIENEVLLQMARGSGLRISDEDVIEDISKLEPFQSDNGQFDQGRYQMALQRAGMTSSNFEQQMRTEMLLRQLQDTVSQSAFVTDADVTRLAQIEGQKRDIVYAMIKSQPIYDSIEVSEADINSYYESNIDDYRAQAKVKIDYLDLTIDSLTDEVSVTEEDLRAYYENNKSAYSVDETRKVTQMYIKLDEDAEQTRVDQARETMEFIREKLDEGMTMDEISTQYQSELGPDFEQISLGHTPRGVMAPELDEVVFAMEEDETSDIIHSRVGMHIVRLDGVNHAGTPSFDSVREDVEEDYRRYQAEQLFFEYADRLATLSYENPHTLEIAADELGMEIQTSDWFTEGSGVGIAAEPKVAMTSFSDEILREELNSEPIELGDSRLVVLRKADYQPSQPLPLEQVREEIIDDIKYERARKQAAEQGQSILQALRDGKSREALAAEYGIEWQQAEGVTRDDPNVNRSVLRTAFGIAAPGEASERYKGNGLGSGDYIIVGVSDMETPAADSITAERKQELRQQLMQAAARSSWQNLIEDARARAEVSINQQNLGT
ncbi:MAG: SurA N-terminal domain-containing protein [Gammaproteobacteria bacterium]|nr:SurA N-terminal domain-containing protein [Gammaproteobacteria bacterium]